ncbi:MAG TPA: DNA polymerase III subunit beta [Bacteroidales bacterium]|nr:DNA polymerase III subunit beta [Bacteroidales bacterium]
MDFIISSTTLLKGLQSISGVLTTNNSVPILNNFLFTIEDNNLTVTASDLETTISVKLTLLKSEKEGSFTIPAKILLDTLKTFSDIPLHFIVDEQQIIEITAGEGVFKLAGSKGEEFPKMPQLENTSSTEIASDVLVTAINKTIFATGEDEFRPAMAGVFCQLSDEGITFVATDAHKLVKYHHKGSKSDITESFIIPKKPLNQLKSILANCETPVKIEFNQTNAAFSFNNVNLVCRLIEGKYPNYEAVIPVQNSKILIVDRLQFLNSLKRVSIFANQSTNQVRFKITGRELTLTAEDIDLANAAKERLTCNFEGEDIEIGFNSKFVIEMLNNIDTEQIRFEMSAPNRAGLILPINNEESPEELLMLVMPIMLS